MGLGAAPTVQAQCSAAAGRAPLGPLVRNDMHSPPRKLPEATALRQASIAEGSLCAADWLHAAAPSSADLPPAIAV